MGFLKEVVRVAGYALEQEDRYILGSVAVNRAAYANGSGGILRINNERYYQFLIARALMSSVPYKVDVEVDTHDLVLEHPEGHGRYAVVEMKRWMSATGNKELLSINRDISQKLSVANADHRVMMIFSANPVGQMSEQLEWLSRQLGLLKEMWVAKSFLTLDQSGKELEFWVAGIEVA